VALITVGPAGKDYTNFNEAWGAAGDGDTIEIFAGTYTGVTNVSLTPGTRSGVTVQAHAGDTVIFDGQALVNNIWDFQATCTSVSIYDIEFVNPLSSCIVFRSGIGGTQLVDGCEFGLGAAGNYCIYCVGTVSLVTTASVFYQYDDGITAPAASTFGVYAPTSATVLIDDNCDFHCLAICIQAMGTSAVTVNRALLHTYDWALGAVNGFSNTGTGVCSIQNSILVGFTQGVANTGADNAMPVQNCLVDLCTSGIYATKYCSAIDNNILIYCNKAIYGDNGADQPAPNSNCFLGNTTDVYQYTAATNSSSGDPHFTDRAGHDYSFAGYIVGTEGKYQKTPCCDSGEYLSAITEDYDGNPRPRNSMYDIGPYEFQGTSNLFTNRAVETATGDLVYWVSPCNPDLYMTYHPDTPDPADYEDFVVVNVRPME